MYFHEFYASDVERKRYIVCGSNEFLKDLVIRKIIQSWGKRFRLISQASDMQDLNPELFGNGRPAYVVESKVKSKIYLDYMIKKSKSNKIPAEYTKHNFVGVVCNDMFPSQTEEFCFNYAQALSIPTSKNIVRLICRSNDYDAYSIMNSVKLLSYVITMETDYSEIIDFCQNISRSDSYKIVDKFLQADYGVFVSLLNTEKDVRSVLFMLAGALRKVYEIDLTQTNPRNWYSKRLKEQANKLRHVGILYLISTITDMALDFKATDKVLLLRINQLIYKVKGY